MLKLNPIETLESNGRTVVIIPHSFVPFYYQIGAYRRDQMDDQPFRGWCEVADFAEYLKTNTGYDQHGTFLM